MDNIYFFVILVTLITAPPTFAQNDGGSIFYYGNKTATLSCNTTYASKVVSWFFKNNQLKSSGDRYRITSTTSSSVLEITNPTRDDAGQYTSVGSTTNCTVNYTAAPLVLDMVKSLSVEKGEGLKIVCDIRGYPPAEVVWQRNGVNLTSGNLITLSNDSQGNVNANLYINNVQYSDEGTYTCIAYSQIFNSSSTKSLVVRIKNPIAWVWPLIGIIVEILLLGITIFICAKLDKRRAIRADFNDTNQSAGQGHGGARKHGGDKHD